MALDRISLSHFRNHTATQLDGARQFNLLVGKNGAGKTNILEALSLLAPGRGMRRAPLGHFPHSDHGGGFAIGASLAPNPLDDLNPACSDSLSSDAAGFGASGSNAAYFGTAGFGAAGSDASGSDAADFNAANSDHATTDPAIFDLATSNHTDRGTPQESAEPDKPAQPALSRMSSSGLPDPMGGIASPSLNPAPRYDATRLIPENAAEPIRLGTFAEGTQPGRRQVRINGGEASAIKLGEWLWVGWLTPAMDRLFTDTASGRRRFLDRLALAINPEHARSASRYEAALRERNRLLQDEAPLDPAWVEGIEAQMAEHGAALATSRAAMVGKIMEQLSLLPPQPFARPALTYAAGGPLLREDLTSALREGRARDRAASRTLVGPHRDDMLVQLEAKQMDADRCSTGEQKAMLIAIILAHATLAARGRPSLLLLDEVAAHLDPLRREALFDRLRQSGAQIWMTGTELAPFAPIASEAAVWRIEDGSAAMVEPAEI